AQSGRTQREGHAPATPSETCADRGRGAGGWREAVAFATFAAKPAAGPTGPAAETPLTPDHLSLTALSCMRTTSRLRNVYPDCSRLPLPHRTTCRRRCVSVRPPTKR